MPRNTILALCCGAALAASAACSGGRPGEGAGSPEIAATPGVARPPGESSAGQTQVVTASATEARVPAGGAGEAVVTLGIAEGYHVNANPPSDKFYVGTVISASGQGGVSPGEPVYPSGVTRKFQFSDSPLSVYEDGAAIRLPLKAEAGAPKGRLTLPAKVRVQPCNDRECLPPRDVDANITVVVE